MLFGINAPVKHTVLQQPTENLLKKYVYISLKTQTNQKK